MSSLEYHKLSNNKPKTVSILTSSSKLFFSFSYLHNTNNNKQQTTTNNNKRRELDGKFDASQQRSAQLEQSLLERAHALVSRRDALRGAPGGGFGGGGGRRGGRGMTFINLLFLAAFHNK